jgi:hypothetical protein
MNQFRLQRKVGLSVTYLNCHVIPSDIPFLSVDPEYLSLISITRKLSFRDWTVVPSILVLSSYCSM